MLENTSDHCPIFCKIKVCNIPKIQQYSSNPQVVSKPCWKKASPDEKDLFVDILESDLNSIEVPNLCDDVHCSNQEHIIAADDYLNEIVNVMENACNIALPIPFIIQNRGKKYKKVVPGWHNEVASFQEDAQFWFCIIVLSWKAHKLPSC